jgi:hypothetical protein
MAILSMRKVLYILAFCLFFEGIRVCAQEAGNWYFPEGVGLRFDAQGVHSLPGGKVFTTIPSNVINRPTEGGASISDSKGNLLFYTDGVTVWNRNHMPMKRGQKLMGGPSTTQPASIVPDPGNPSRFYVFTLDDFQHVLKNGLRYSVVDICLDNGLGDITEQKDIPLLDMAGEKQAITKHKNDTDFWLVVHKHYTGSFYAYKISATGISRPVVSTIGSYHGGGVFDGAATAVGQMKISPDGTKIGLVNGNMEIGNDRALLEVFDFNTETGVISNFVNLTDQVYGMFQGFYGGYGFAFSPNGKNIFTYTTRGILQFQQYNGWWSYVNTISQSSTMLKNVGGMQLAPNGKIYVAKGESYLAAITAPDNLVPGSSGFILNDVFLDDGVATWSLPGFYDGFRYTHKDPVCLPGKVISGQNTDCWFHLYPNPFTDHLLIRENTLNIKDIHFYNMLGQLVLDHQPTDESTISIDTRNLPDNLYLVVITRFDGTFCVSKLVKK